MIAQTMFAHIFRYHCNRIDQKRIKAQKPPDHVTVCKDKNYRYDGKKEHCYDVYYPSQAGTYPLIINVHGGGLLYGWKENNQYFNMHMAKEGAVVCSINYSLAPHVLFHEQLQEICDAICEIDRHRAEFPCEEKGIFLTGDSAGALLCLYVAGIMCDKKYREQFQIKCDPIEITALGLLHGMFYTRRKDSIGRLQPLFYGKHLQVPYLEFMNPETILSKHLPPMMFISSEEDPLNCYTVDLCNALKQREIQYTCNIYDKQEDTSLGHIFAVTHPEKRQSKEVIHDLVTFFQQIQKGESCYG